MRFAPIGPEGQAKLAASAVCIVGMGALGTVLANHLVRAGVGLVRIVDRDFVERSNLQRQMLYDEEDAAQGLPKAIAAQRKLQRINSDVRIDAIVADVTARHISRLLDGIDLVLDGTDNFETRFLLNDACFREGIPFVYGGAVSSQGMSALLVPGETPCLRCFIQTADSGGQTCDTIGVIAPVVDIVASYQAVEAMKVLIGAHSARRNTLVTFDVWSNRHFEMKLGEPSADCPCCGLKQYPALQEQEAEGAVSLCGRSTVQITGRKALQLSEWQERLKPAAVKTELNPYLLRVELPEGERLVLFPDGRVLVQGTDDPVRAKTLYARYIGV
ncbi:ThiF family adenylyltransferase [Paenibacillus protaetiae]|uniref:Thiazole biosynthesis adenylyltransferase ThiF n=1 Tax=Paenibacillus protaetiae TaxID=2509456 RepID=A0A4P6FD04_9BACL|nr:ThiF family adenylyltransferase [Paenibacillus protaetiae]QAY68428.1 thiazole biosynthesis adenylyltransferase ThiF [Paenibacillus protaetiae]